MLKKTCALTIVLLIFLTACNKGKYDEVKNAYKKIINIQDEYSNSLKTARNANEVADAINKYADDLENILPELMEVEKRNKHLFEKKDIPVELKESQKDFLESARNLAVISTNVLINYFDSKKVRDAVNRLKMEIP